MDFCGQTFEADKTTEVVCKSLGNESLDPLAQLGQLSALVSLDLGETGIKTLGGMGSNLSSLEVLDISSTQVTSLGALHKAKSLKRLVLYGVALKDWMGLVRFRGLSFVDVDEGQIPANALLKLQKQHPKLVITQRPMGVGGSMASIGAVGSGCWNSWGDLSNADGGKWLDADEALLEPDGEQ